MDNSVLMNKEVVDRVQKEILIFFHANGDTPDKMFLWETFKAFARGVLIGQRIYMKRKKYRLMIEGLKEVARLEIMYKTTQSLDAKRNLDNETTNIKLLEVSGVAREIMYNKQNIFEYRDKPNKHLARLLATSERKLCILDTMFLRDGSEATTVTDKLKVFFDYYTELYKSKSPMDEEIDNYLTSIEIPRLADNQRQNVDGVITAQEIDWAIGKLKINKAPGLDGITAEFYKKFGRYLTPYLQDLFKFCLEFNRIPESWQEAKIVLIAKARAYPEFYRPISLLNNTDYKILTMILVERLNKTLDGYIAKDQTGFMKGRFMKDNIRKLRNAERKLREISSLHYFFF